MIPRACHDGLEREAGKSAIVRSPPEIVPAYGVA